MILPCLYTQALEIPYEYVCSFIDSKIKTFQYANKRWEDERVRTTSIGGKLFTPNSESIDFSTNLKCFRPLIIKLLKVLNLTLIKITIKLTDIK